MRTLSHHTALVTFLSLAFLACKTEIIELRPLDITLEPDAVAEENGSDRAPEPEADSDLQEAESEREAKPPETEPEPDYAQEADPLEVEPEPEKDVPEPEPEQEPEPDLSQEQEQEQEQEPREVAPELEESVDVCQRACNLLNDCGYLDPISPFGATLEACLYGAGASGCNRLWGLAPATAQCILDLTDCNIWLCLLP